MWGISIWGTFIIGTVAHVNRQGKTSVDLIEVVLNYLKLTEELKLMI